MVWKIELGPTAENEISKLDRQIAIRILKFLKTSLYKSDNPRLLGESLKGKLGEHWKYRVGDYRIICDIVDKTVTVLILKIGNQKEVYR
jgi:mRNA interferase RelE/StbE